MLPRAEKQKLLRRELSWRNNLRFVQLDFYTCFILQFKSNFYTCFILQSKVSEVEVLSARNELKLAVRRAEDLQVKICQFDVLLIHLF